MTTKFISQLCSSKGFQTGTGATITFVTLIAIYSLAIVISLPGLAISPILANLQKIFPKVSEFELQMLESLPSLVIIPTSISLVLGLSYWCYYFMKVNKKAKKIL